MESCFFIFMWDIAHWSSTAIGREALSNIPIMLYHQSKESFLWGESGGAIFHYRYIIIIIDLSGLA